MHIVMTDGRVKSAGDALLELMAMNPKTRRKAQIARLVPPLRRKADREYRAIADRRGELSERVDDVPPVHVPPAWVRLPDR